MEVYLAHTLKRGGNTFVKFEYIKVVNNNYFIFVLAEFEVGHLELWETPNGTDYD